MNRIINRLFLLGAGLLLSVVGSGCCHTCNNHGSCLGGYQDGCGADSGCDDGMSGARVSRLRRTRQRVSDACSASTQNEHEATLSNFLLNFGDVQTVGEVVAAMQRAG